MSGAKKITISLRAAFAILFVAGCASTLPDAKRAGNGESESTRRAIEWAKQSAYRNAEKQSEEQWANPVGALADDFARSNGYTTLHIAASKGQLKRIKALLENGAEVDQRSERVHLYGDSLQRTPLHAAIHYTGYENSKLDTVEVLLKAGADANAQDWQGQTPLHYALKNYDRTNNGIPITYLIVEALLSAGASPSLRDSNDQRPIDVNGMIAEYLERQHPETYHRLDSREPTERNE